MPDHTNEVTRAIEQELGPFTYDEIVENRDDLILRGPFELDNKAVYVGTWN